MSPPSAPRRCRPWAIIEVLSPDDSLADLLTKFDEYRAWGVSYVWLVDPERHRFDRYDGANLIQVEAIELPDRGRDVVGGTVAWDLTELPVPSALLIYTEDEWRAVDADRRFARTITRRRHHDVDDREGYR